VTVKKNEELHSGILQSPDDIDATYRKKGKEDGWGQSVNVTETANPENELNLLTEIAVQSNKTDDSNIMNDRIEPLKEKTPDPLVKKCAIFSGLLFLRSKLTVCLILK
jgi:hypothetical protein